MLSSTMVLAESVLQIVMMVLIQCSLSIRSNKRIEIISHQKFLRSIKPNMEQKARIRYRGSAVAIN